MFSQEALVGVKCRWNRGCFASHFLTLRMLVRGVVVQDQVQIAVGGRLRIDELQELQPLLMAMPILALPDEGAIGHIERRKERRGAVADVVMGHRAGAPFLERQAGLRAVQRLDLALLVAAEDERVLGRIQIQPDHILELFGKARIVGDFEGARQMRLEPVRTPDAADRAVAQVQALWPANAGSIAWPAAAACAGCAPRSKLESRPHRPACARGRAHRLPDPPARSPESGHATAPPSAG